MKANYHSHTTRCGHARGTEREFVEKAIENGFEIWGFSDHTPYPFDNGFRSGIRMDVSQFEDYVNTVLALKKEYEKDIRILLGIEVEYFPAYFDRLMDLVSAYPVEYMILAQHFVGNEPEGIYSGNKTRDLKVVKRYADQIIEAIKMDRFLYLAHPGLINYVGEDTRGFEEQMRRICVCAKENDMPLEVNFLGLYEGRQYPRESFWRIAGEEGCKAVFGIDAHNPDAILWPQKVYQPALDLIGRYGVELVEILDLKPIFR